ncbi:MAG: hypothetical protein I3273_05820 [Candidatus Moeniiplasma glomeromycotorum]|nr:hypothetical protein [Candidatus Moeniiplasma glomeromycotorum]MCE8169603.1 hypothetical protein [Candidatus Moeniiplasma glomeromycotorum]
MILPLTKFGRPDSSELFLFRNSLELDLKFLVFTSKHIILKASKRIGSKPMWNSNIYIFVSFGKHDTYE